MVNILPAATLVAIEQMSPIRAVVPLVCPALPREFLGSCLLGGGGASGRCWGRVCRLLVEDSTPDRQPLTRPGQCSGRCSTGRRWGRASRAGM